MVYVYSSNEAIDRPKCKHITFNLVTNLNNHNLRGENLKLELEKLVIINVFLQLEGGFSCK